MTYGVCVCVWEGALVHVLTRHIGVNLLSSYQYLGLLNLAATGRVNVSFNAVGY